MEEYIVAGIVTYNPDLDRLRENIESISSQVKKVIVFDNGSKNQERIKEEYQDRIILIPSSENIGIAAALNHLMQKSKELGATWMLSLDQDSVCSKFFCVAMSKYLKQGTDFGIVAPVIVDRNVGVVGHNPQNEYMSVRTCITSGAFTKIEVWQKIGGYDESMFIDSVDFEFCYRVRKAGYKVIQVRDVQLLHEIGKSEKRRLLFWTVDVKNHSAFRKYYIAQNNVYYPLKHKLWLDLNGYLFDFLHGQNAVDVRSPFVGLFETLFLEQAGSVKNYVEEDGVIKANRLEYEYVQNGEPTFELQCVQRIQAGALEFVRRFGDKDIYLSANTLFKGIEDSGLRPAEEDLKLFADFKFYDEGEMHSLAKPKSMLFYMFHVSSLKRDFLSSRWKIGFMKKCLKIRLPYERLYQFMLRYK